MKKSLLLLFACITSSLVFANLTQSNWRWRNNDGTEKTATWKGNENSATTINDYNTFRLRLEIDNGLSDTRTVSRNLQYASSPNGPWFTISDRTQLNAFIYAGSDQYITNAEPTTKQLSATNFSFVPGSVTTNAGSYNDTIIPSTGREYEWCVKATQQAQPFTTYYFKAAEGDAPAVLPSLTTGNAFPAKTVLLSNSSFENGLTGWSTATQNSSTATFSAVQTTAHTGANALQVAVTNPAQYLSVSLSHGAINLSQPGLFLLRFWALADERNALLTVNIKTASGNDTCKFQVYNRFDKTANNWQMYQYAFSAPKDSLSVQMSFNTQTTYYLDDIEVISAAPGTVEDITSQYNWQNNQVGYGWLSGDNDNSVLLPDSTVAWIFSDSYLGNPLPHSNVIGNAPIINNLIVHEVNDQYTSVFNGTSSNPQSLFSPGNGNIFWNSGGVVEGNNLQVVLIEIAGDNYNNGTYIGTLSLPDLKVTGQVKTSYAGPNSPNTIFQDGDYNYIYIGERVGPFENYSQVARVPVGSLASASSQWEFYTNDNTWSTEYTNVKRIIAGVEAASVVKLGENNYVMSGVPSLSNEVAVWFAESPVGPWGNKTVLYYIPSEEGVLPYEGHIDKGSGKDGNYTLSYSVYPFSGLVPQQYSDKGSYIPYYIKANLPALSPFTKTVLPLATSSFTVAKQGAVAKINFTVSSATNSSVTVYKSTDAANWLPLQTITGISTQQPKSFQVYDNHPANGVNYYKLKETTSEGRSTESNIKALVFDNNNIAVVTLYQNPAKASGITYSIQNYVGGKVTATLTNLQGKRISTQSFTVSAPTSVHTLAVNTSLATGIYMLTVQGDHLFKNIKVLVQQ